MTIEHKMTGSTEITEINKDILSDEVDVIIDVADASALERNLYLTLQLLELGKPVVLALNMMDIVEKRGMEIDTHRLPEMLGIPVIPVSARKRTGLDVLLHAAAHHNLISFVCLRPEGAYESPATVSSVCRTSRKKLDNMDDFHFHQLRHTYTSNLLSSGAAPKDVQELLGHADVSTTMNIYAHATREAKRTSARLLDKVVGAV